jgi:DNA invertase Pin-like site-specific DNA recombinase
VLIHFFLSPSTDDLMKVRLHPEQNAEGNVPLQVWGQNTEQWSVDRLGRSLQELVAFLGELHAKGVDLYLHQQGIDTGTPAGKAMFQMLGVFAEFERAMIVERVKSGLARARSQGKRLGRRPVSEAVVERIRAQLATGAGILKTAKALGCGVGTVHRIKRGMAAVAL